MDRNDPNHLRILSDSCPFCKEEKEKFIERCFAGGAATWVLDRPEHNCDDSGFDREAVRQVYPHSSATHEAAPNGFDETRAFNSVCAKVSQHRGAVTSLRDELIRRWESAVNGEMTMNGAAVICIIEKALRGE